VRQKSRKTLAVRPKRCHDNWQPNPENPSHPAGEDDPHAWQRNARLLHQGIAFVADEGGAAYALRHFVDFVDDEL
jgi:hypothetical protein